MEMLLEIDPFRRPAPGHLTIKVDVFNNSINPAKKVKCEFFGEAEPIITGREVRNEKLEPDEKKGKKLGEKQLAELPALGRSTLALTVPRPVPRPDTLCYFTVRVSCDDTPVAETYWNIYPANSLATQDSAGIAAFKSIGL